MKALSLVTVVARRPEGRLDRPTGLNSLPNRDFSVFDVSGSTRNLVSPHSFLGGVSVPLFASTAAFLFGATIATLALSLFK